MPPLIESIYDHETVIEDAWASVVTNIFGIKAATPRTANTFQKERPRVEGMFESGTAKQSYHVVGGRLRNATWQGQLETVIITQTGTNDTSNAAHRSFRAQVRNLMAGLKDKLNGDDPDGNHYLPNHEIQNIVESSISPIYKHEQGIEQSRIAYRVDFGIRLVAWQSLATV